MQRSTEKNVMIHATTIAKNGRAVLITGASGAGKSDLALRLIQQQNYTLISDDQTILSRDGINIIARTPQSIPEETKGKIEVRGVGIISFKTDEQAILALHVDLGDPKIERLPDPAFSSFLGIDLPRIVIDPFEISAGLKISLSLEHLCLHPLNKQEAIS